MSNNVANAVFVTALDHVGELHYKTLKIRLPLDESTAARIRVRSQFKAFRTRWDRILDPEL